MDEHLEIQFVRRLAASTARIHAGVNPIDTLHAVADGVVECLGFSAAAIEQVDVEGDLTVLAVSGPDGLRSRGVGDRRRRPTDVELPGPVDADDLVLPLSTPTDGLVGVLSAELSAGAPRPSPLAYAVLDAFGAAACSAIQRAQLMEQLQAEHHRLDASEQAFRFAFAFSAGAMATLSLAPGDVGRFLDANEAFCAVTGLTRARVRDWSWNDLVAPEQLEAARQVLADLLVRRSRTEHTERQLVRPDGRRLWATLTSTVIENPPSIDPFILVHLEDTTERHEREELLRREAVQDSLTGLGNRRALLRHLDESLTSFRLGGRSGAVIYGDLDLFKRVNDVYGHTMGDHVLRQVAQRLMLAVRESDFVARIGGDEFVVVAHGLTTTEGRSLADRIRASVADGAQGIGGPVAISLGVATFDAEADAAAILKRADLDMYLDKAQRRRPDDR